MCAFLRCESPSAFLETCLSHHSFIILLITSTSALLSGWYLISTTFWERHWKNAIIIVSMPSRAYTSFLHIGILNDDVAIMSVSMPSRAYTSFLHFQSGRSDHYSNCVNALSGLYLISTLQLLSPIQENVIALCQCPLGLIPHFYN